MRSGLGISQSRIRDSWWRLARANGYLAIVSRARFLVRPPLAFHDLRRATNAFLKSRVIESHVGLCVGGEKKRPDRGSNHGSRRAKPLHYRAQLHTMFLLGQTQNFWKFRDRYSEVLGHCGGRRVVWAKGRSVEFDSASQSND